MIYRKQFCVTSYGVFTVYPISDAMNSKWVSFALTYDGNKFIMYINGVKTRVVTASNGIDLKKSPLYIGGFAKDALGFQGEIDSLYIFSKCLNEREINKYMNNKGDFEVKKPENNIPLLDEDNIFNVKNYSETGWNDFVYAHGETKLNFAIRLPDGYDKTKKYPLVVFITATEATEKQPKAFIPAASLPPFRERCRKTGNLSRSCRLRQNLGSAFRTMSGRCIRIVFTTWIKKVSPAKN